MSRAEFDLLIVGSGPSGVQAAKAAVQQGVQVGLVDVGHDDRSLEAQVPDLPFSALRATDPHQRDYLLGDGPPTSRLAEAGPQITPPRRFVMDGAAAVLPIEADGFHPLQSLALGGLGAGWGAGCATYEPFELRRIGLPVDEMRGYYADVCRDVGISADTDDDVAGQMADVKGLQPPLDLDSNARAILSTYRVLRRRFLAVGFQLGRPPLAVLSRPLGSRLPNPYHDLDFYGESRGSIYRPRYTLDELRRCPNFRHVNATLVESFQEGGDDVTVQARDIGTGEARTLTARRLLLAAGAINSARIALRSLGQVGQRVPIPCNPYTYVPAVNLRMLGRAAQDRRHSLAQLTALYSPPDSPDDLVCINFFSYRSLLLFRLVREMPLPPSLGLPAARLMLTSLTIAGVHHADSPSPLRWLALAPRGSGQNALVGRCSWSPAENASRQSRERQVLRRLLELRCLPLALVRPAHGASVHYAGTLPMSEEPQPLTCDQDGRLHEARRVFVADGASWRFLPAKGPTFTLMANARRVADRAAADLKSSR